MILHRMVPRNPYTRLRTSHHNLMTQLLNAFLPKSNLPSHFLQIYAYVLQHCFIDHSIHSSLSAVSNDNRTLEEGRCLQNGVACLTTIQQSGVNGLIIHENFHIHHPNATNDLICVNFLCTLAEIRIPHML